MNFYANIMENKGPVIGDPYFLQTKEEIIKWLDKAGISEYVINDDLTIDVNRDVDISTSRLKKIPVKFGIIKGSFNCKNNKLTSLKGSPDKVNGSFHCHSNELTSLEYCPNIIKGDFYCSNNELTSLEHCPTKIGEEFNCGSNKIKSLKGCPDVLDYFACDFNELTSFEYFPIVKNLVYIDGNSFKTLKKIKNVSSYLLIELIKHYFDLDWKEIEWDKVKNLDEIVIDLHDNMEKKYQIEESQEALKRIEELQLYQEEL